MTIFNVIRLKVNSCLFSEVRWVSSSPMNRSKFWRGHCYIIIHVQQRHHPVLCISNSHIKSDCSWLAFLHGLPLPPEPKLPSFSTSSPAGYILIRRADTPSPRSLLQYSCVALQFVPVAPFLSLGSLRGLLWGSQFISGYFRKDYIFLERRVYILFNFLRHFLFAMQTHKFTTRFTTLDKLCIQRSYR